MNHHSKKLFLLFIAFQQDFLLQTYRVFLLILILIGLILSSVLLSNLLISIPVMGVYTYLYLKCFKVLEYRQKDVDLSQKQVIYFEASAIRPKEPITKEGLEYTYFKAMQDTLRDHDKAILKMQKEIGNSSDPLSSNKSATRNKLNATILRVGLLSFWAPVFYSSISTLV